MLIFLICVIAWMAIGAYTQYLFGSYINDKYPTVAEPWYEETGMLTLSVVIGPLALLSYGIYRAMGD